MNSCSQGHSYVWHTTTSDSNIQVFTIKVKTTPKLTIVAAYSPLQVKINPFVLDAVVLPLGLYFISGDFNAKHTLWNKRKKNGSILKKLLDTSSELQNNQIIRSSTSHSPPTSTFSCQMSLSHKIATPFHHLPPNHLPTVLSLKTQ